jgi:mannan endo-1,4-beta-mannosidase
MGKRLFAIAALALSVGAALFLFRGSLEHPGRPGFVQVRRGHFVTDGRPFRFVGANAAVTYGDDERVHLSDTLRAAASAGVRVVRVWAFGGRETDSVPTVRNEDALLNLDRVIGEAARNNLRVQLCLTNWWRDTEGVVRYLRWANLPDAADDNRPYGINAERAMLFYTNEATRRLYREHVQKIATRRNTVTGILYRDDPTIFGYELMNEAQAVTGRWAERRAWIAEMSGYLKSLDPDHLVAPGDWGYRSAAERREWVMDHALPNIDYCDVHIYPSQDQDSFVDSPEALRGFIDNRVAAAYSVRKPLVFGEFGMNLEGYKGVSQRDWFRAFFEGTARAGTGGAMFWLLTPDPKRLYGVTYTTPRDQNIFAEIKRASETFASLQDATVAHSLAEAGQHLVPRQSAFRRAPDDPGTRPQMIARDDHTLLYRFKPEMAVAQRFEKIGGGVGFIWGSGVGFVEYIVPERKDHRRVGRLLVRAHLQPVLPADAPAAAIKTRVTLFVNGTDCGSRLVPAEDPKAPLIQEWSIDTWSTRLRALRGLPVTIRFAVLVESDWLYGINISNWPAGYDSHDASPVEFEVR